MRVRGPPAAGQEFGCVSLGQADDCRAAYHEVSPESRFHRKTRRVLAVLYSPRNGGEERLIIFVADRFVCVARPNNADRRPLSESNRRVPSMRRSEQSPAFQRFRPSAGRLSSEDDAPKIDIESGIVASSVYAG